MCNFDKDYVPFTPEQRLLMKKGVIDKNGDIVGYKAIAAAILDGKTKDNRITVKTLINALLRK